MFIHNVTQPVGGEGLKKQIKTDGSRSFFKKNGIRTHWEHKIVEDQIHGVKLRTFSSTAARICSSSLGIMRG